MATPCSIIILELGFNQNTLESNCFSYNKFNKVYFSVSEKIELDFAFSITALGSTYSENTASTLLQNSE